MSIKETPRGIPAGSWFVRSGVVSMSTYRLIARAESDRGNIMWATSAGEGMYYEVWKPLERGASYHDPEPCWRTR